MISEEGGAAMKVAFCGTHHNLPFADSARNPNLVFDPSMFLDWQSHIDAVDRYGPLSEHWVSPMLQGLSMIEMPGVMAHISLLARPGNKVLVIPYRVWINVTTEPTETGENGMPIVLKDGVPQVSYLWSSSEKHQTSPLGFLKNVNDNMPAEFWRELFSREIREKKTKVVADAEQKIAKANALIASYSVIPDAE
jgi:hypothetical protein